MQESVQSSPKTSASKTPPKPPPKLPEKTRPPPKPPQRPAAVPEPCPPAAPLPRPTPSNIADTARSPPAPPVWDYSQSGVTAQQAAAAWPTATPLVTSPAQPLLALYAMAAPPGIRPTFVPPSVSDFPRSPYLPAHYDAHAYAYARGAYGHEPTLTQMTPARPSTV